MSISSAYHANGKLLLTGEYFVLHGAKAIALPLKVGQQLRVQDGFSSETIRWQALYKGEVWFSCELNPFGFAVINSSHPGKAETLSRIFQILQVLNPDFQPKAGTRFETTLDTHPEWGLGSSSTLISLVSQWAGTDPFALNELVFQGSGFDIACATANGPVFYLRNKPVESLQLDYPFVNQLFLVYSGKKKETGTEVKAFLKERKVPEHLIGEVSVLSDELAACRIQNEFNQLIRQHERLVGRLIGQVPVKEHLFADFDGEIKSLGAWGGDFYLVSTSRSFAEVKKYFDNRRLTTIFRWNDLILKREIQ